MIAILRSQGATFIFLPRSYDISRSWDSSLIHRPPSHWDLELHVTADRRRKKFIPAEGRELGHDRLGVAPLSSVAALFADRERYLPLFGTRMIQLVELGGMGK
ncbi:hypothetical protein KM043_010907 [Ampulex compressa]|nr:hypothetical protein KM043_010907 [Ampulex compressa]